MKYQHVRQHKHAGYWTTQLCRSFCPYVLVQLGIEIVFAQTRAIVEGAELNILGTTMLLTVPWATVASALNANRPIQF